MKKVMLIYPSGDMYQRGEDRCQINVAASVANSMRSCNDLGYAAAILKNNGYSVFLKDYQSEKLNFEQLKQDFLTEKPDVLFVSITNGSIFSDLNIVKELKKRNPETSIILKGALFFNPEADLFKELDLTAVDYLIGGETEFIIAPLLEAHFKDKSALTSIEGISYKMEGWKTNPVSKFNENLDEIPFPERSLMHNELYINPATNKPMATIATSRGCPSSCIYCVSPVISGRKVRFRSPENVLAELTECVEKHNITDFFFKSDTFTINKQWVLELCKLIINSNLNNKITWCANSRVNTIDEEMLEQMKKAGCKLIALGLESGSSESLLKMKKGVTLEQNINAVNLIKKHGIQIFGFYLIGFPWENKEHLKETEKLIFKLNTDFIELSIATPFKGSELYKMVYENIDNGKNVLGKDSFKYSTMGTEYLSAKELEKFRKKIILRYHTRPSYILKKITDKNLSPIIFYNYIKYGLKILKNTLF